MARGHGETALKSFVAALIGVVAWLGGFVTGASAQPPTVVFQEFDVPGTGRVPTDIVLGPDGHLWFTEEAGNRIGRILATPQSGSPVGTVTEFLIPTPNSGPTGITLGPLRQRLQRAQGSGVIVGADGYILTNHHVVAGANEIQTVSTKDAMVMARELARQEGIFAGTSTGANVTAALRIAERLGPGHTVVTVAVDSGMKYLSTELYRGNP